MNNNANFMNNNSFGNYGNQSELPTLNLKSHTEGQYYYWYISTYANSKGMYLMYSQALQSGQANISTVNDYINQEIHRIHSCNYINIENFISQAQASYKDYQQENTFNETELEWLKDDVRACYWFWYSISNFQLMVYSNNSVGSVMFRNLYQNLSLSLNPVGNENRYNNICSFMKKVTDINKKYYWTNLKSLWDYIITNLPKPLSWAKSDDPKQREWAINYILDKNIVLKKNITHVSTIRNEPDLPISILIDSLNISILEKKAFLRAMNSAWNQVKVREGKKDKKAINAYISQSHKIKLDELSKTHHKPIEKIIEMLIDEYNKNNDLN